MMRTISASNACPHRARRLRAGYSLAEVVVAMAVLSVVLTGLAASLTLVTRVAPTSDEPPIVASQVSRALNMLADDLLTATEVDIRSDTEIRLLVPDRSSDGIPERLVYQAADDESGRGMYLARTYNNGAREVIVTGLAKFTLGITRPPRSAPIIELTATPGGNRLPPIRCAVALLNAAP